MRAPAPITACGYTAVRAPTEAPGPTTANGPIEASAATVASAPIVLNGSMPAGCRVGDAKIDSARANVEYGSLVRRTAHRGGATSARGPRITAEARVAARSGR